ncbi:hypothetical protein H257_06212 [Aphanomyces astaci]|uniref:Uncharacterized protein n=1 Tax=Aphanomyces astaci TaxID=112090 RepID=W4GMX8_APHAT|nr:hypothetical protein H257_06212 [Aphanomyces astaci]ETV80711.1 hypothetical protein H257_06212 [Aphanomyces astaci]KAF0714933.1 hypothetical protein AaE_011455 [Aphanomyces astaci]|eukprot:XP_009829658.1 hypothetical protein H257_06212 [Aphanomyces astaci]
MAQHQGDEKSMMDKVKDSLHAGYESTSDQFQKFKSSFEGQDEKTPSKATQFFESVKGHPPSEAQDTLEQVGTEAQDRKGHDEGCKAGADCACPSAPAEIRMQSTDQQKGSSTA